MAPGSSVWPATMNMDKSLKPSGRQPKPTAATTKAQTNTPQAQTQTQTPASARVGTRSTTTVTENPNANQPPIQVPVTPYTLLLRRKEQLYHNGKLPELMRIQAAINVGMILHWTADEVVWTVEKSEQYAIWIADGLKPYAWRLTARMMEVVGETEVLDFVRRVREDGGDAFETLRRLRAVFGAKMDVGGGGTENDEIRYFAPLLLTKIQAALNIAFRSVWEGDDTDGDDDTRMSNTNNVKSFDMAVFKQKATHLLRVPSQACGEEILCLLRLSKLGRKRFGDLDSKGRAIAALPGIERRLIQREKMKVLDRVKSELQGGREMIKTVVELLGHGTLATIGINLGWVEGGLSKRAMTELDDEGFLVLSSMYRGRTGGGILVPDYVVDGEEEEEIETADEGARW